MPLRFLPDSSHSCRFWWILEELILAETSAKITIPGVTNSRIDIGMFPGMHRNGMHRNPVSRIFININ